MNCPGCGAPWGYGGCSHCGRQSLILNENEAIPRGPAARMLWLKAFLESTRHLTPPETIDMFTLMRMQRFSRRAT